MNTTGKIVVTFVVLVVFSGLVFGLSQCGAGQAARETDRRPATGTEPSLQPASDRPPDAPEAGRGPAPEAPAALAQARSFLARDELLEARRALYAAFDDAAPGAPARAEIKELLGDVNIRVLFSPYLSEEKEEYFVQPGDSLARIANRFGTTVDVVRRGNGIEGDLILPGTRLRVFKGTCRIEVDCAAHRLALFVNDRWFKEYPVGTGAYDRTPIGTFEIVDKVVDPVWWREGRAIPYGDPENILGTRWMSINVPGFGVHGTWDDGTVGSSSSAGCVRMHNADVEELFDIVPLGAGVVIHRGTESSS